MPENIGILGGSFDPVHRGHLEIARLARQQLSLDRILFLPAARPPHKQDKVLAEDSHRLAMLQRALETEPSFQVEGCELKRGGVSYTVDTLEELQRRHPPGTRLFLIIGGDNLAIFPKWREAGKILELATVVVYGREGFSGELQPGMILLEGEFLDVSSTSIRQRLAKEEDCSQLLDPGVAGYIREHGLYR